MGLLLGLLALAAPETRPAKRLDTWVVDSAYQGAPTRVEVLAPADLVAGRRYPVVYVLPVNPGPAGPWGDPVAEAVRGDLATRHQVFCVFPTFERMPWYADHPTDPLLRQESHFVRVVLPLVEASYPVLAEPAGRLLLGFSKSGWGAWSLLLRHPERFGRAAAWDAPLQQDSPTRYEMGPIFGTQANFEGYRITSLLDRRAPLLRDGPARLVLLGMGNFRGETERTHQQMVDLGIPHVYRDGPTRKHAWDSGWLPEALALLTAVP